MARAYNESKPLVGDFSASYDRPTKIVSGGLTIALCGLAIFVHSLGIAGLSFFAVAADYCLFAARLSLGLRSFDHCSTADRQCADPAGKSDRSPARDGR